MAVLRKVAPHAAEAFRRVAVAAANAQPTVAESLEAVILVTHQGVLAVGGAVDQIEGGPLMVGGPLPLPLAAVVSRLEAIEIGEAGFDAPPPAIRMTAKSGALVTVQAARLRDASGRGPIVLTIATSTTLRRACLLEAP
jgi:hypothetical protein